MRLHTLPIRTIAALLLTCGAASAAPTGKTGFIRTTASTPEQLLEQIYNTALIGNDRLADIENYMSRGLKADYKSALKKVTHGKKCDIPRIISNDLFTGKLKGFDVKPAVKADDGVQVTVMIKTGAEQLPPTSELKRFDPAIYEKVVFTMKKPFIDWKIDNITASEPDLTQTDSAKTAYRQLDIRAMLKSCAQ